MTNGDGVTAGDRLPAAMEVGVPMRVLAGAPPPEGDPPVEHAVKKAAANAIVRRRISLTKHQRPGSGNCYEVP
jgi:hypothetical protein